MNTGFALLALAGLALLGGKSSTSPPPDTSPPTKYPRSLVLAPGYTLGDMIVSDTRPELAAAIVPTERQVENLAATAGMLAQLDIELRERGKGKARINSGLRDVALNNAVGGEDDSQHLTGEAVDLEPPEGWNAYQLAKVLVDGGVPFDQLIAYTPSQGGHVHVSFTTRRKLRRIVAVQDRRGYHPGNLGVWKEDG